jgi:predicted phage replisome organizer
MSGIYWIKLKTDVFSDEKIKLIEAMPDADSILIILIKLWTLAGKTNDQGMIYLSRDIPYSIEMLGTILSRSTELINLAIETLEKFEMIKRDDKGFITIENWEKHQNIEGMEKIREQNRLRKKRQREKEKELSQDMSREVTQQNKNKNKNKIKIKKEKKNNTIESGVDETKNNFESFRKAYPGTKRGLDAEWNDFVKKYKDWREIIPLLNTSLENQKKSRDQKKFKGDFVPEWKNLKTWLNQSCWTEELGAGEKSAHGDQPCRKLYVAPKLSKEELGTLKPGDLTGIFNKVSEGMKI